MKVKKFAVQLGYFFFSVKEHRAGISHVIRSKFLILCGFQYCVAKYRVIVDRSKCVACGAAPAACPEVFELGSDNGKNRVIDKYSVELTPELSVGVIPEELYDCARAGAEACPVDAIRIEKIEEG